MIQLEEHTILGITGHFLVILCFVSAITLAISAYFETKAAQKWEGFSKKVFYFHAFCTLGAIAILYHILASHYFEFNYAWKYSSRSMPFKYIIASLWSGQEGSFLLWTFWTVVLLFVLFLRKNTWRPHVVFTVAILQAFLYSMLLGVYIGGLKIGTDPFVLIRELPENVNLPWANMPDYLNQIASFQDGKGLNPLLQNYWMTIHPPILFLGFASVVFTFAFAVAGIWKKQPTEWVKPAMPWTLLGVGVLGCGILLGGVWAYEALSFGGFWAWDPVENASLVPWIFLVAALHVMQIVRAKKTNTYSAYILSALAFIAILYASFLTRSGILGDSSVHSFSENDITPQLFLPVGFFSFFALHFILKSRQQKRVLWGIGFVLFFVVYSAFGWTGWATSLFITVLVFGGIYGAKQFGQDEERIHSKEFWMFIGALVLVIASLQIIFTTSIPVINRLAGTSFDAFTALEARNLFYARWQIPFAIVVAMGSGVTLFLKFRANTWKEIKKQLWLPFVLGILLSAVVLFFNQYLWDSPGYYLLAIACCLGLTLNGAFFFNKVQKQQIAYSTIAHVGFLLILLGSLFSGAGKRPISKNTSDFNVNQLSEELNNETNILMQKGDTILMDPYFVSYKGKSQEGVNIFYNVDYFENINNKAGKHLFTIQPFVQLNEKFGNVPEPGTQHFVDHDVFTYIKWADLSPVNESEDPDYMGASELTLQKGASLSHENWKFTLENIWLVPDSILTQSDQYQKGDLAIKTALKIEEIFDNGKTEIITNELIIRNGNYIATENNSKQLNIKTKLIRPSQHPNTMVFHFQEREYIVMEALVFPLINCTWIGCVLMVLGSLMAMYHKF